ncbi:MAG: efflux RND transporter periplasmic adaptor subunit [Cellvibrionaceae bacterium]
MSVLLKKINGRAFLCVLNAVLTAIVALAQPLAAAEDAMLPVDCVINPSKTVDLSAAVSGVLESISVSRSEFVEQGQEVARLESSVELASVELATKRANINAEVHLGEINLGFDRREKKRITELYQKKAVSYRIKDEADREAKLSEWELQQARDLEDIRWLELKRAHAQLSQKIVRSSISGFVTKVHRFEGEYVEDQPIVRVVQLNPLFVEAIVPMKVFGRIYEGMEAEVAPETVEVRKHTAKVIAVDRLGDTASGTFGVRLELSNTDHQIPAGLKCGLRFLEASGGADTVATAQTSKPSMAAQSSGGSDQRRDALPITTAIAKTAEATADNKPRNIEPMPDSVGEQPPTSISESEEESMVEHSRQTSIAAKPVFVYRFGPLTNEEQLQQAQALLAKSHLEVTVESGSVEMIRGYIVLATGVDGHSPSARAVDGSLAAGDIVDYLSTVGLDDYQVFRTGEHKGRVSLGVLYTPAAAKEHQAYLARRGVSSIIKPRSAPLPASWLTAEIAGEDEAARLVADMGQLSVPGRELLLNER